MLKNNDKIGGVAVSKGYSVKINVGGRTFGIISDSNPEYLYDIANKVDKSIAGILNKNPEMTFEKAAILSALMYCDDATQCEILKKQEENSEEDNNLRQQVINYSKELEEATQKCKSLEKELHRVKCDYENRISQMKKAVQTRENQFREYINKLKSQN